MSIAADTASSAVAATRSSGKGTPKEPRSAFDAASDRVRDAVAASVSGMAAYPSDPWDGAFAA
jgi:hypothetical protein